MKCHDQQAEWKKRKDGIRCSYCGSMAIEEALKLLSTPGTHYSGSDWKYGWPHKFYIGDGKFYSSHLLNATHEQMAEWNKLACLTVKVKFEQKDNELLYSCPKSTNFGGFQAYGIVEGEKAG